MILDHRSFSFSGTKRRHRSLNFRRTLISNTLCQSNVTVMKLTLSITRRLLSARGHSLLLRTLMLLQLQKLHLMRQR